MLKLLKQFWWKIIGMLLLLYVLAGGLLVPLGPGIKHTAFRDNALFIVGKNTHFTPNTKIWLKQDSTALICVPQFTVVNPNTIQISQTTPLFTANNQADNAKYYNLIIDNPIDGTIIRWRAFEKETLLNFFTKTKQQSGICNFITETKKASFFAFPNREILNESIRNLLYHVPMWFAMVLLLLFGAIYAIAYLSSGKTNFDIFAKQANLVGLVFGIFGLLTGMVWANFTWGTPWTNDPKLNGAAIATLAYLAYFILRGSVDDEKKQAKLAAVYNIFAFAVYIMFIFVIPRLNVDTLHPGQGGNPAFSSYDLDNSLRAFFYPAVIGWTILGFWITSLLIRLNVINKTLEE